MKDELKKKINDKRVELVELMSAGNKNKALLLSEELDQLIYKFYLRAKK